MWWTRKPVELKWDDPVRQVQREAAEAAFLADPDALCKSMWNRGSMIYQICQRPIAQSIPHEHRQIESGHRYSAGWAMPGNYHNKFERVQIEADAKAWLEEPIERPKNDNRNT